MPYKDFPIRRVIGDNKFLYGNEKSAIIWLWPMGEYNGRMGALEIDYDPLEMPSNTQILKGEIIVNSNSGGTVNFGVGIDGSDAFYFHTYELNKQDFCQIGKESISSSLTLWNNEDRNLNPPDEYYARYRPYRVGPTVHIEFKYLRIYYEYIAPKEANSLAPDKTTINPRVPITFTWDTGTNQEAFELSYRVGSNSWQTITKTTSNKFYEMPANTITSQSGTLSWRIRVKEAAGIWSAYSDASVELGTVDQKAPLLTYPVGDYVKNNQTVKLKWDFISNTTETQSAAEIKYKIGTNSWKSATVGSQTEYTLSNISTNFTGAVYWQARVKNQFDQWSDWSSIEQFQIVGAPPIPSITNVSNQNKPIVKWTSNSQEAFTIEILKGDKQIYSSDIIVSSTIKEFRIKDWLENSKYTIKLTIFNKYGIASPTATYTLEINPQTKPDKPDIKVFDIRYGILIRTSCKYGEVYRDGVHIGDLKDGEYKDYTGTNGKDSKYYVRAIQDNCYTDSTIMQGITNLLGKSTLATMNNPENFVLLEYNLDAEPKKSLSLEIESKEIALSSRKYNFTEYGIKEKETLTVNYLVDDYKKLKKLIQERKTLIYRDSYGFIIEGTIININSELTIFGYLINFTITKTGDKYE